MAVEFGEVYSFDEFELAPDTRRLSRGNQPVHLTKKPFNVLTYLIQNRERMVTRRELLDTFWDGHDVYEETLTKCVGAIRKALGDNPENPRLIETFWAEGYRFIGDVNDQYVPAQSVSVVERTRAVTITVEDDVAPDNRLLTLPLKPAAAKYVAAAGLFILVCALTGVLLYRSSNAARGTHHLTRSLAVLPLKNLTGDPGDDYLCDGVTESLINSLSKLQNL